MSQFGIVLDLRHRYGKKFQAEKFKLTHYPKLSQLDGRYLVAAQPVPVTRVLLVVNDNLLPNMGRMTQGWRRAARLSH